MLRTAVLLLFFVSKAVPIGVNTLFLSRHGVCGAMFAKVFIESMNEEFQIQHTLE